jgi:hypothetical protein
VARNLSRLNQYYDETVLGKRKAKFIPCLYGTGAGDADLEEPQIKKRKIPPTVQLFLKTKESEQAQILQHWSTILKTQILDESNNDTFRERRRELLINL